MFLLEYASQCIFNGKKKTVVINNSSTSKTATVFSSVFTTVTSSSVFLGVHDQHLQHQHSLCSAPTSTVIQQKMFATVRLNEEGGANIIMYQFY